MNKKRALAFLILGILAFTVFFELMTIASAQDNNQPPGQLAQAAAQTTQNAFQGLGGFLTSSLTPLFGNQELLTRVFFFILLLMIVYSVVETVFHNKNWVNWLISIIVSLLALIALPVNFIEAIRTQYGAMGAAILSIIPFIIILMFSIRVESALVGRMVWVFYVIYYFALYVYQIAVSNTGWLSAENIPYFFAILAGLIMLFGMGPIRSMFFKGQMSAIKEEGNKVVSRGKLLHGLQKKELEDSYGSGGAGI